MSYPQKYRRFKVRNLLSALKLIKFSFVFLQGTLKLSNNRIASNNINFRSHFLRSQFFSSSQLCKIYFRSILVFIGQLNEQNVILPVHEKERKKERNCESNNSVFHNHEAKHVKECRNSSGDIKKQANL